MSIAPGFLWVLRIRTQVLKLLQQAFTHGATSLGLNAAFHSFVFCIVLTRTDYPCFCITMMRLTQTFCLRRHPNAEAFATFISREFCRPDVLDTRDLTHFQGHELDLTRTFRGWPLTPALLRRTLGPCILLTILRSVQLLFMCELKKGPQTVTIIARARADLLLCQQPQVPTTETYAWESMES